MPKYVYHCEACKEAFEQFHSIKVKLEDCHLCGGQDVLVRLPSCTRIIKIEKHSDKKPGHVIKKHIEEAKREIDQEKREMIEDWTP